VTRPQRSPVPTVVGALLRRPRTVVVAWVLLVLVGGATAPVLFERLSGSVGVVPGSESLLAARQLQAAAPSGEELYAVVDGREWTDPAVQGEVQEAAAAVRALPGVTAVVTPYEVQAPGLVADDGRAVTLVVQLARDFPDSTGDGAVRLLRAIDAPRVLVGGGELLDQEMDAQVADDLQRAELLSLPVVLVLLLVLFGGLVAASLPVVVALVSVAGTFLALTAVSLLTDVSVYSVNIVTMLGLGLAVDYALLLVTRFREERAVDPLVVPAVERTLATAGRTVLFSGLTVGACLTGLLVFSDTFLRSMGAAGLAVVLLAMLAALTLLPALLVLLGARVRPAAPDRGRLFARVARASRRRPLVLVLVLSSLLLAAGTPFLGVRFANPDARSLPESSASRQLQELATERFAGAADVDPVTLVGSGPLAPGLLDGLRALPDVRGVAERQGVPGLTVVDVVPVGESQGDAALDLVDRIRALPAAEGYRVTGDAAFLSDYSAALVDRLPLALTVMVGLTCLLLFLFTGSVVLPVKAVLLGMLSLGAGLGALVVVFQDGHLGSVLGTPALGSLSTTTPVLVFVIAFGLSMDYEVFLLGRIAEEHRKTGDTDLAVERGLQATGRVVTSAALLLVVVFAGFIAGGFSPVRQVGVGLVVAVVIDVTLVRMLLLPAVMRLMGEANWWAPAPLRRLHGRVGLAEAPSDRVLEPV
jgi:RND superfamily putative drug exporter